MRISDWSSDVCSSDLLEPADFFEPPAIILRAGRPRSDNRIEPPPRALIDRHAAQARSQAPASDSVCMDQIIAVAHPDVHHDIPAARNRAVIGSLPGIERAIGANEHPFVERKGNRGDAKACEHQRRQDLVRRNPRRLEDHDLRSEEHTSELQSLMSISYA